MSRKSIIFPVNNKGGVGKTSLLVDLMSMLSLDYRVGFLDMDGQSTLYGTLTGDYSYANAETSICVGLDAKVVELFKGTEFRFAHGSKRLKIKVNPGHAPIALFPLGLLYDNPATREKLESIVQRDMSDVGMIAVDLPPIPHAGLILDHSLMPVIESTGGDVDLFPLVVTTPEKNTLDIGLNSFALVQKYLTGKGIPESRVHPIVIVNKVDVRVDREGKIAFGSLDDHDREKLRNLEIIFDATISDHGPYFDFKRKFTFQGRKYRVQWMPFIEGLRSGDFHLLYAKKPELFNFPQIYQIVLSNGYINRENLPSDAQRVYSEQMGKLSNFVRYYTSLQPARNYTVNKNYRPRVEAQTSLVSQIRTGQMDIDQMLKDNPASMPDSYHIGNLVLRHDRHHRHQFSVWIPAQELPVEALARAIAKSEVDLGLGLDYIDESWKSGDYPNILSKLKAGHHFTYENSLLEVETLPLGVAAKPRIDIDLKLHKKSYERQRELFDAFLGHLDIELRRSQRDAVKHS